MLHVKSSAAIAGLALLTGVVGCSEGTLSRFAPPGIIKYEDIAGEKPANPAIAASISERKEAGDQEFPLIAQTPGQEDRPTKPKSEELDALAAELTEARDQVNSAVAQDRQEAELDNQSADALLESREGLASQVEQDNSASKSERAVPLVVDESK